MLGVLVPAPSGQGATAGPSRTEIRSGGARLDADAVFETAQRCLDPRHSTLVRTAQRHGRVFTADEALGWCVT
jgi:hypothetical protein